MDKERSGGDGLRQKTVLVPVVALLAGVLGVAGKVERVRATAVELTLYGSAGGAYYEPPYGWGFTSTSIISPGPDISVDQYDNVTLTLISQDGRSHQFFVDYDNNTDIDPGEPVSQVFTEMAVLSFNASLSGTFTYHCAVHPFTMYGRFIMNAVVPEFSLPVMLPFFVIATMVIIMVQRAKH